MADVFSLARSVSALQVAQHEGIQLRQRGSKWWACCPLHVEKTASLAFYEDGSYYCFGCSSGGDGIGFFAALRGVSQRQAAQALVDCFGLTGPAKPSPYSFVKSVRRWRESELKRLRKLLSMAQEKAILSMEGISREAPFPEAFVQAVHSQTDIEALIAWISEASIMELYQIIKEELPLE